MIFPRKNTHSVSIGRIGMGGDYPVRLQSMSNTNTANEIGTIAQIKRIIDAGAELVRVTVPSMKEIEALKNIKKQLIQENIHTPLIADVHFNRRVAEVVASVVEKVRINPGNYVDKKKFEQLDFTDSQYSESIERMALRAKPLLEICKQYGTVIRIGTNHGSLSDRIVSRYGNTSKAMVQSAIEWLDVCENYNFRNVIFSMKSSNVNMMIESTLLFADMMEKRGVNYPLHLGVTEAGAGLEGRIKSAVGIGTLLLRGLGDTIRISLTEKPENELFFAKKLMEVFESQSESIVNIRKIAYSELGSNPGIIVASSIEKEKCYVNNNFYMADIRKVGDIHQLVKEINGETEHNIILCFNNEERDYDAFICSASIVAGYYNSIRKLAGILVQNDRLSKQENNEIAIEIMQACRLRMSKTEIISCPSCGRTQYDIEMILAQVKEKFSHYTGLKLGVMGCIVNGPGEMADADYGIVGAANGKVALYKGQERLTGNITTEEALVLLESLIKNYKENQINYLI